MSQAGRGASCLGSAEVWDLEGEGKRRPRGTLRACGLAELFPASDWSLWLLLPGGLVGALGVLGLLGCHGCPSLLSSSWRLSGQREGVLLALTPRFGSSPPLRQSSSCSWYVLCCSEETGPKQTGRGLSLGFGPCPKPNEQFRHAGSLGTGICLPGYRDHRPGVSAHSSHISVFMIMLFLLGA